MPRLTKKEWMLVDVACHCLWDSLDISNSEIEERLPEVYKENKRDMEVLDRIMEKIKQGEIKEND